MKHRLLLRIVALVFATNSWACVSSGKYDAAVADADATRADLQETQSKRAQLQKHYDESQKELARLQEELANLGANTDALRAEKGSLASELGLTRARLEEMRRAQTAADARARQYRDLAAKLQKMVDAGDLRVVLRDGRMVLQLPNDVLFDSGRVAIKPKGKEALQRVAKVLASLQQRNFQVAGHTDNVPIALSRFPSNWELSTARGVEVVKLLIAEGVSPNVLAAAGYGEFDPLAPNTDDRSRALNRRIEITLQPNVDELVRVSDVH